jgi:hypothetical protein
MLFGPGAISKAAVGKAERVMEPRCLRADFESALEVFHRRGVVLFRERHTAEPVQHRSARGVERLRLFQRFLRGIGTILGQIHFGQPHEARNVIRRVCQRLFEKTGGLRGIASVSKDMAEKVRPTHLVGCQVLRVAQACLRRIIVLGRDEQLAHLTKSGCQLARLILSLDRSLQ